VKGAKAIRAKTVFTILMGWFLMPTLAAVAAYLFFKVIRALWG
jgi:phosphate/sulfate permease